MKARSEIEYLVGLTGTSTRSQEAWSPNSPRGAAQRVLFASGRMQHLPGVTRYKDHGNREGVVLHGITRNRDRVYSAEFCQFW